MAVGPLVLNVANRHPGVLANMAATLQEAPFEWEGRSAGLGGSFGVRAFAGHADPEVWLAEADAAMWVRKKGR